MHPISIIIPFSFDIFVEHYWTLNDLSGTDCSAVWTGRTEERRVELSKSRERDTHSSGSINSSRAPSSFDAPFQHRNRKRTRFDKMINAFRPSFNRRPAKTTILHSPYQEEENPVPSRPLFPLWTNDDVHLTSRFASRSSIVRVIDVQQSNHLSSFSKLDCNCYLEWPLLPPSPFIFKFGCFFPSLYERTDVNGKRPSPLGQILLKRFITIVVLRLPICESFQYNFLGRFISFYCPFPCSFTNWNLNEGAAKRIFTFSSR